MKVIFSRKGWDSGFGGRPSPVFPDGSIQSLPIHDCSDREAPHSKITPHVLKKQGYPTLDKFLEVYHREGVPERHAHLDPDLDLEAFQRKEGWLPSFGQSGGPATHLDRCHVSVGDLFLFYGWFDDVILTEDRWINRRKNRYVIWGWLQVGHVFLAPTASDTPEWLHYHPHVMDSTKPKNRIYSASESLELSGELMKCRGGGIFGREHSVRCLTHTAGQRGLYPDNLPPWLAVKGNMSRQRQEQVWDTNLSANATSYLRQMFEENLP